MNYVPRVQEKIIRDFVEEKVPHKDVLLVEGARQTGKTTLVEHVLSGIKRPVARIFPTSRRSLKTTAASIPRPITSFSLTNPRRA
jgi:predicted AAA+ superfamily ATPase